jgi:Ca-activated chloride channel family protein
MFRFEHPEFLIYLIAVPILLGLYMAYRYQRKVVMKQVADEHLQERLLSGLSKGKEWLKWGLFLTGLFFICISYSNPQWGYKKAKVERKAADVYIALDISNSMLAEDVPPSRLERAKKFAIDLVQELKGDRIGLILFAGSAYLQMPLTTDYAAAEIYLQSANPNNAGTQGTSIAEALEMAMRTYDDRSAQNRALVLISDGEDHEEGALEMMEKAKEAGVVPYIIGVGTEEGGFIPMNIRGREDYKRDETGSPVRTIVNETFMQELATSGNGRYFNIANSDAVITSLKERINQLEKEDIEERSFSDFESYFQYFLGIGLVLLLIDEIISNRKGRIRKFIQQVKTDRK